MPLNPPKPEATFKAQQIFGEQIRSFPSRTLSMLMQIAGEGQVQITPIPEEDPAQNIVNSNEIIADEVN